MNLEDEKENLAKADRDIAAGEERIARQIEVIKRMRESGQNVAEAEKLLALLHQTLDTWRDHRDEILRTIARLESGGAEASLD